MHFVNENSVNIFYKINGFGLFCKSSVDVGLILVCLDAPQLKVLTFETPLVI